MHKLLVNSAILLQQLVVGALLNEAPLVDHNDLISPPHSAQSMCNQDDRVAGQIFVEGLLNLCCSTSKSPD